MNTASLVFTAGHRDWVWMSFWSIHLPGRKGAWGQQASKRKKYISQKSSKI